MTQELKQIGKPNEISTSGRGIYVTRIHYKKENKMWSKNAPYLVLYPQLYAHKVFKNPENAHVYAISYYDVNDQSKHERIINKQ